MKKQTFAAYRHIPTDKIHILDLDLFTNQQISNEDGATSLACEYVNEDGEKDMAVIWSGLQDEPGVTYLPIPDDQNREILEAYFKCRIQHVDWSKLDIAIGSIEEYRFTMYKDDPDHVVAKVEFVEPKTPCQ